MDETKRPMEKKEGGPITSLLDRVNVIPAGRIMAGGSSEGPGGREAGESKELPSASLIFFPELPSSTSSFCIRTEGLVSGCWRSETFWKRNMIDPERSRESTNLDSANRDLVLLSCPLESRILDRADQDLVLHSCSLEPLILDQVWGLK